MKIWTVWFTAFIATAAILVTLVPVAGVFLLTSGINLFVPEVLPVVMIAGSVSSAVVASGIALITAFGGWLFKSDDQPRVSINATRTHPPPEWPWHAVLFPSFGLYVLLAASLMLSWYLVRPDHLYANWQWFEFLPLFAALLSLGGAAWLGWGFFRSRDSLKRVGWRLRGVILLITGLLGGNALEQYSEEIRHCPTAALQGMVHAQNVHGLAIYLKRHDVCHQVESPRLALRDLLFNEPELSLLDSGAMMRSLLEHGADISREDWRRISDDGALLSSVLAAVADTRTQAKLFSSNVLSEEVTRWLSSNDLSMLGRFTASGLRFDTPGWRAHVLSLVSAALDHKSTGSREMYEVLLHAGMQIPSSVRTVLQAGQTGSVDSVAGWKRSEWMAPADPEDQDSMTLLTLMVAYTDDKTIRGQMLALSNTDEAHVLPIVPMRERCYLADRLGAEAVMASLSALSEDDDIKVRCRRLTEWIAVRKHKH